MRRTFPERAILVLIGILFEGGLAGLAGLLGWLFGVSPTASLRWNGRDAAFGALAIGPMLLVFWFSLKSNWRPLAEIREFFERLIRPAFSSCSILELALVSAAAGFGEEVLFRGLIQGGLETSIGRGPALVLTSMLFGLAHPITTAYIVLAGLLGLYLGALWMAGGNLLIPIVAHGLYDFVALVILLRGPTRGPIPVSSPMDQDESAREKEPVRSEPSLHPDEDVVLLQMPDEQIADGEVDKEAREHEP